MVSTSRPRVSVILVNYRGAADTANCVEGLGQLDWPADDLEIVVVDNASEDGSTAALRRDSPPIKLIELEQNVGFAGACNRGAEEALGEYIAFINNDARPHRHWLQTAVAVLDADSSVSCVASKVLDWDGQLVDFAGAALSFYGHGFKLRVGEPESVEPDVDRDVLFASGSAMIVRADLFRAVGGFDERYFMFFEDVDFGWRLWLLGHRVRYVPSSIVYHRHHASVGRLPSWWEHQLLERNALFTIYKNYDEENLAAILPAALLLTMRRGVVRAGADSDLMDVERAPRAADRDDISRELLASVYAIDAFAEALPTLELSRRELQATRRRDDREILRLFELPFHPNCGGTVPRLLDAAADAFGIRERFDRKLRVLVATGDTLTPQMAGPAIRAWHIASALSLAHEVQLVTHQTCELTHPRFVIRHVNEEDLKELEEWCDVLIFQGYLFSRFPFLYSSSKVVVVDVYDPFHLEQLEQARDRGYGERGEVVKAATRVLNEQLLRGDFFMCASEKQRDFWLGQLSALGRVNPQTYDDDETLEALIAVVPFGIPETPPAHDRQVIKGVVPGIGPNDKVILWGGGIYNWFDPLTLLHAVDRLRTRRSDVRLFFLGVRHPNPEVPEMRMAVRARQLADELGLTGTYVFFNEGWVPYEERQSYLLEADVAVSTHLDHVETAFSFRTRVLDYLWASIPVVATQGDALADLIEAKALGITVPPGDVEALEEALFRVIEDQEFATICRKNISQVAPDFAWPRVLQPLLDFCRRPQRAPDLVQERDDELRRRLHPLRIPAPLARRPRRWRADVALARSYFRDGGASLLARKALQRVRNRLAGRAPTP